MARLEMNPAGLRASADTVEKLRAEHASEMKSLRTLVLGLDESWKGEAGDAFIAKFLSMDNVFREFEESLGGYSLAMRSAADKTENLDAVIASGIRSL